MITTLYIIAFGIICMWFIVGRRLFLMVMVVILLGLMASIGPAGEDNQADRNYDAIQRIGKELLKQP